MALTKKDRELLEEALERHRLYLMAKNDYRRFESCVGADKAADVLSNLKHTHKTDARLGRLAVRSGEHCNALTHIRNDANAYAKGPYALRALGNMKLHLLWCFFSHVLLLFVAGYFLMTPWMNRVASSFANSAALAETLVPCLVLFLSFLWNAKNWSDIRSLYKFNKRMVLFALIKSRKCLLSNICAPILFIGCAQYVLSMPINKSEFQMLDTIGLSVVMFSIIWFILDCMAGLSPRNYFFCPEGVFEWFMGFFKGKFSPFWSFTPSISNSYNVNRNPEDYYRSAEHWELRCQLKKSRFTLSNSYGELEFHPSPSLKFIVAYALTDLCHTGSIIAAIYGINTFLLKHDVNYSVFAAVIAFSLVWVMLNRPIYATNRFHWFICKNLYAYRVSHLFRKLFYSIILLIFAGYMLQAV